MRRWHFTHPLPICQLTICIVRGVCAVNASELERLKKRFMKLDRCIPPLSPDTLCPLP